jgi:hypothetical protein
MPIPQADAPTRAADQARPGFEQQYRRQRIGSDHLRDGITTKLARGWSARLSTTSLASDAGRHRRYRHDHADRRAADHEEKDGQDESEKVAHQRPIGRE